LLYFRPAAIFSMIVIPALDIRRGKVAQLTQGRPGTEKFYGNPVEVAKNWEKKGAKVLHVVDLDAAIGDGGNNLEVVKEIRKAISIPIQFGGGIRTLQKAREVLNAGIDRAIVGSAAVKDSDFVKILAKEYGKERIMVAVDCAGGEVVIKGWAQKTGIMAEDLMARLEDYVFGFLVTDVDKEGLLKGIDAEEFKRISKATKVRICASGGVTTEADIRTLEKIGVWGCVVGKALYEGKIKL